MVSITAFGRVAQGGIVRRNTAGEGDLVVVTGTIGDAVLGLALLRGGIVLDDAALREALIDRYRMPQPRTGMAASVREHASAAMDVSDGLAGDLLKLCAGSGLSAEIDAAAVPLSDGAQTLLRSGAADVGTLLAGGDDYEILCTLPENRWEDFSRAATAAQVRASVIGRMTRGTHGPVFRDATGHEMALERLSYSHF